MLKNLLVVAVWIVVIALGVPLLAEPAPTLTNPYQQLTEKADVLVSVKFVLKVKMTGAGGDREIDGETTCLLIDAKGLVLCSNTELGGFVSLMSQMMGRGSGFDVTAAPREIEVFLDDRSDGLAARLLARDTERDLAWVQLDESIEGLESRVLDLDRAFELGPGDRFYRVRRLDKFFGSVPVVGSGTIAAVISKPRKLWVPADPVTGGLGQPVFTADGRLVGITVIQMPAAEDQIGSLLAGGMSFLSSAAKLQDMVGGLILPASEVAKATRLARVSFAEDDEGD